MSQTRILLDESTNKSLSVIVSDIMGVSGKPQSFSATARHCIAVVAGNIKGLADARAVGLGGTYSEIIRNSLKIATAYETRRKVQNG